MSALRSCKVCLLGDVDSERRHELRACLDQPFANRYLDTVGVVIGKLTLEHPSACRLLTWEIAQHVSPGPLLTQYLRGASAVLMLADGAAPGSLQRTLVLAREAAPSVPRVGLLFAPSEDEHWELPREALKGIAQADNWLVVPRDDRHHLQMVWQRLAEVAMLRP